MKWILPETQSDDLIEHILKLRNIDDFNNFLNPDLGNIHSPLLMYGVEKAAKVILKAIEENKKIFIHGDFDVDGITATSIMWDFLFRKLKADVMPYIPSRFDEGYGLSDDSIENIIEQGGKMIITVDCGVKDLDIVEKYKDKIDFVITDHHTIVPASQNTADQSLENTKQVGNFLVSKYAKAVVHPKLGKYPFAEICGAMVSWKVCCGINLALGNKFDMNEYLDLVSIGTICDVMPLINENRVAVKYGLLRIKNTDNEGIKALFEIAGINHKEVKTYQIGFVIGPRLNAAGRIAHALDAVRLMSTKKKDIAKQLATKLNELNLERQELTKKYFELADLDASKSKDKVIFVYGDEWPEGIVGLIAGKLAQKYHRPVLVGSLNEGKIKGSARSIEALNISETLKKLDQHLIRHGGHSQAAGFQMQHSALSEFQKELNVIVDEFLTEDDLEKKLSIDYLLDLSTVDTNLISSLSKLEPFGAHNEEPIFAIMASKIMNYSTLGANNQHVKIIIKNNGSQLELIQFNASQSTMDIIKDAYTKGQAIDVAGFLENNFWNGNVKAQMKVVDIRLTEIAN